jgi:hypothetical protein
MPKSVAFTIDDLSATKVIKPMPRMSRAKRYGLSVMT